MEEILSSDKKILCSNLTKGEGNALYSLREDTSIIIKKADKGSGVVVWDKEDYLGEAKKNSMIRKFTNNLEEILKAHVIEL